MLPSKLINKCGGKTRAVEYGCSVRRSSVDSPVPASVRVILQYPWREIFLGRGRNYA